ncbi:MULTISPECIES: DsbA family protein [Haloferax]|uniref:Thioredoxin domain-containing protein n=2 Tax=Haloferax TaxID=2251 RepID=A0A6G1Z1U5_9EURY|nr:MULTISPECIES: DsbA family oxidoreductase [Haloferax]KAB1187940.1 DsbA family oxidoreductase [Haloferax sp. CBA1149]MRW80607.1 thioredoxin domain-containing protein [Haloferax marinisediminis]
MTDADAESITVYSDYVCPFCYLGRESLKRYQETREDELDIDWHPFDLRSQKRRPDGTIDFSVDDGKDEDYYEQAKQGVRRLQDRYNVEMKQEIATDVDSLPAQVASYYVKQHYDNETWLAFDVSIFEALWQEGSDIGDEALLVELAEDAGIDGDEIRSALDDDTFFEEVREQFAEAQRHGVTGVPTFAYEGYAARGAVPPEQLERLVEGV